MFVVVCIVVLVLLVLLNGCFSMTEMAMVNARKAKLQEAIDNGVPGAKMAMKVAGDTDRMFAAIQVGITFAGFAASAVSATAVSDPVANWLIGLGMKQSIASFVAVAFMTVLIAYITLVFGELLPKRIGMANSEKVAIKLAKYMHVFELCARPLVKMLQSSTNCVAKILGVKSSDDQAPVSEEEIKILVNEHDSLLDEEKRMIGEIFDLGDTVAREIMVPRVDMQLAEDTMTVKQVIELMRGTGLSRVPVFHEDHDSIIGIAMVKDLLVAIMDDHEHDPIVDWMREPVFVPETKDILPLLSEMQNEHNHLVIVVDEYGGTAGLLSIEDILEEVVGEIADEYDPDRKYVTRVGDNEWVVDGRLPIDDAIKEGLPIEESGEYDTVAGWLMDTIDFIPSAGDRFSIGLMDITVQSMHRRSISFLRIEMRDEVEGDVEDDGAHRRD